LIGKPEISPVPMEILDMRMGLHPFVVSP
jgi:hypothetical protein